ncbi:hypothetical protein TYRP_003369 [Tyrophagus putrescentiae]|nr:hypothetical protein TYRP_003369 [Tyrophagus putrescentiae]
MGIIHQHQDFFAAINKNNRNIKKKKVQAMRPLPGRKFAVAVSAAAAGNENDITAIIRYKQT